MQDRSTLPQQAHTPISQQANPTEITPLLPRQTSRLRSRRRRCTSIALGTLICLATFCILFFAVCNPFQFVSFFNDLSDRVFQGPYWSSDSRAGWWYRLFVHEHHTRECRIRESERYNSFDSTAWWNSGCAQPELWSEREIEVRTVPDYVLEYAPLIHLFSDEEFWPSDIAEHLVHTTPYLNYSPIAGCGADFNLSNLNQLNRYGRFTYLQSNDNVEDRPKWLGGARNIPTRPDGTIGSVSDDYLENIGPAATDEFQEYVDHAVKASYEADDHVNDSPAPMQPTWHSRRRNTESIKSDDQLNKRRGGRSDAPAILLVVPKPDGIVDAFWFFFYSYNLGNKVLNIRFGNHVGDWEHTLVRFKHGKPESLFFSEHFFGEAYSYQAVEKIGKRPVGYSATGTHAMYGTPGIHRYILPLGLLHDETDRGPLWDPRANMHAYTYDANRDWLRSSTLNPYSPTEWFYYMGHWGDKAYPLSDSRQYRFAGEYHYVSGPLGPRFKNLRREKVCQQWRQECVVKHWRPGHSEVDHDAGRGWGDGESEEIGKQDKEMFLNEEGKEKTGCIGGVRRS